MDNCSHLNPKKKKKGFKLESFKQKKIISHRSYYDWSHDRTMTRSHWSYHDRSHWSYHDRSHNCTMINHIDRTTTDHTWSYHNQSHINLTTIDQTWSYHDWSHKSYHDRSHKSYHDRSHRSYHDRSHWSYHDRSLRIVPLLITHNRTTIDHTWSCDGSWYDLCDGSWYDRAWSIVVRSIYPSQTTVQLSMSPKLPIVSISPLKLLKNINIPSNDKNTLNFYRKIKK